MGSEIVILAGWALPTQPFLPPPPPKTTYFQTSCHATYVHTHTHTHTNTNKPAAQENKARLNMEGWVGGFSVFKELTEVFGGSLVGAEGEFPGLKACLRVPMP